MRVPRSLLLVGRRRKRGAPAWPGPGLPAPHRLLRCMRPRSLLRIGGRRKVSATAWPGPGLPAAPPSNRLLRPRSLWRGGHENEISVGRDALRGFWRDSGSSEWTEHNRVEIQGRKIQGRKQLASYRKTLCLVFLVQRLLVQNKNEGIPKMNAQQK